MTVTQDLSILHLILNASWVVQGIMLLLLAVLGDLLVLHLPHRLPQTCCPSARRFCLIELLSSWRANGRRPARLFWVATAHNGSLSLAKWPCT